MAELVVLGTLGLGTLAGVIGTAIRESRQRDQSPVGPFRKFGLGGKRRTGRRIHHRRKRRGGNDPVTQPIHGAARKRKSRKGTVHRRRKH